LLRFRGHSRGSGAARPPIFPPRADREGNSSEDDLRAIARTLVKKAKGGDLPAIRELLNRVIGKAPDYAEA
jgi:hypothetical protein